MRKYLFIRNSNSIVENKFQITKTKMMKNNDKFSYISSRLNFCSPYFWKKIFLFQQNKIFKLSEKKIFSRSSVIPLGFLRQYVQIHSGKKWYGRVINRWNVGFKFGELTWNRRIAMYKAKQLKKKKKK